MVAEAVKASRPDVGSSRLRELGSATLHRNGTNLHQDLRLGENLDGNTDASLLPTADALQKLVAD